MAAPATATSREPVATAVIIIIVIIQTARAALVSARAAAAPPETAVVHPGAVGDRVHALDVGTAVALEAVVSLLGGGGLLPGELEGVGGEVEVGGVSLLLLLLFLLVQAAQLRRLGSEQ